MARSLSELSALLRDRSMWPEGFPAWDYGNAGCCAVELSERCYPREDYRDLPSSHAQCDAIFIHLHKRLGVSKSDVTPEQVADAIDEYLRSRSVG